MGLTLENGKTMDMMTWTEFIAAGFVMPVYLGSLWMDGHYVYLYGGLVDKNGNKLDNAVVIRNVQTEPIQ